MWVEWKKAMYTNQIISMISIYQESHRSAAEEQNIHPENHYR